MSVLEIPVVNERMERKFGHIPAYCKSGCFGKKHLRRYLVEKKSCKQSDKKNKINRHCLSDYSSILSYCGHSRYWSILASWMQACPRFPTPLNSPSTLLWAKDKSKTIPLSFLVVKGVLARPFRPKFTYLTSSPCSSNTTISSTQNTTQARAICPARYVRSSGDWAFSRTEPGRATLTV